MTKVNESFEIYADSLAENLTEGILNFVFFSFKKSELLVNEMNPVTMPYNSSPHPPLFCHTDFQVKDFRYYSFKYDFIPQLINHFQVNSEVKMIFHFFSFRKKWKTSTCCLQHDGWKISTWFIYSIHSSQIYA